MAQATLINSAGQKVVVEVGSPQAQQYFGQGYKLMQAAPTTQMAAPPPGAVAIPGAQYNTRELQQGAFTNIQPIGNTLYGVPRTTTQAPAPEIKRDGADFLVAASQPRQPGLDQWKSGANLVEAARSIIQMKQGYNNDIQSAKQVWQEKARLTGPWEGDQKIFQGMSPADQASIRAKQYAVAESHLQGLSDEEKYRASRTEDTLKYISDIYNEKIQELKDQKADANEKERIGIAKRQNELQAERNRILNAKDKIDMGVDLEASDIYGSNVSADFSRIGFKQGGSLSWRSNNPGNIKFGDFAKQYGAVQGSKAPDGGYYSIFPTEEAGREAMKNLLLSPNYQKLTVEQAMRRWSGNGYGAEVFNKDYATMPLSTVTSQMMDKLVDGMIKREGWTVGKTLTTPTGSKDLDYLSSLTGTPIDTLSSLNLTKDELALAISIAEADKKKLAGENLQTEGDQAIFDKADTWIATQKGQDPNLIHDSLIRQYGKSLTLNQLDTIMTKAGYKWDSFTSKWK